MSASLFMDIAKSFRPDLGLSWPIQTDRFSHRSQHNTRSGARLELRGHDREFGGLRVKKRGLPRCMSPELPITDIARLV